MASPGPTIEQYQKVANAYKEVREQNKALKHRVAELQATVSTYITVAVHL